MSSTSFPASADSASDSKEPECERSPSVKSTPIASASYESIGQMSLFMEMFAPSRPRLWQTPRAIYGEHPGMKSETHLTGQAQSKLFVAASPVRTSRLLERVLALRANAAAYGLNTGDLLAKYDPDTSSWRTSQLCLDGELTVFSETWPRSGMMRNGIAFQLPPLVPLTDEIGSGLWRTPDASIVTGGAANAEDRKAQGHAIGLHDQVNTPSMWSAPCSCDYRTGATPKRSERMRETSKRGLDLPSHVNFYSTPTATRRDGLQSHGVNVVSGSLNPTWVEALMGFPSGWTDMSAED